MFGAIRKITTAWKLPKTMTPSAPEESRGRELILADPVRRDMLVQIKDLQIGIPQEDRSALVDPVLIRFAHYVVDLPCSEHNHDSQPHGLLNHSLSVALAATRELVRPSFRTSEDPTINHREQPIWAYAGFVLGMLHDLGKVFDLDVVLSDGSPAWDPLSEPLSAFLEHHGRRSSGPETWRWKKGRGDGHVEKLQGVAPRVVPPRSKMFLGRRWEDLLAVFLASYKTGREDWLKGPAGRVVAAVLRADKALAEAAMPPKACEERKEGTSTGSPPDGTEVIAADPNPTSGPAPTVLLDHPGNSAPPADTSVPADESVSRKERVQKLSTGPCPPAGKFTVTPQGGLKRPLHERQLSVRDDRIDNEIKPEKLLESIRSLLRSGNISRNSRRAELFVRQEHIWLRYPEALRNLLEGKNITWSSKLSERLEHELLKMPHIAPENPKSAFVYAFLEPRDKESTLFVRLSTQGLLPENELAGLGFWPYEMKAQPTAIPYQKGLPFRAMPGGKA